MNWRCAVCGTSSRTNRRRCAKCGNMRWTPAPKKDIAEVAGPIKRIAPRGLLLAKPGKQAPVQDSPNAIECGACHKIIYQAEDVFDVEAFQAAKKRHYEVSPSCENHAQDARRC